MRIICLGWGSLIWSPEKLKIQDKWFIDGPLLQIEFARISRNQRVTLIIDKLSEPVRCLWSIMTTSNLNEARESLRFREKTIIENIHFVRINDNPKDTISIAIKKWLSSKEFDCAIWTGLSYSSYTNYQRPDITRIISHLNSLKGEHRKHAEEYIRKTPIQINTEYRRKIENKFGWTPII